MSRSTVELRVKTRPGQGENYFSLSSWIPHTFLVVTGPDGNGRGYGLAPAEEGNFSGAGKIYDDTNHRWNSSTGKIEISDEDYQSLT